MGNNINWIRQSLHQEEGDYKIWVVINGQKIRPVGFTEIENATKDIVYLFEVLSNYSYLMGDLRYGTVFQLPYWDYLNLVGPIGEEIKKSFRKWQYDNDISDVQRYI